MPHLPIAAGLFLLAAVTAGCESRQPATSRTGEALERAGSRTGTALGRAAESTGAALGRAGDWARDRTR